MLAIINSTQFCKQGIIGESYTLSRNSRLAGVNVFRFARPHGIRRAGHGGWAISAGWHGPCRGGIGVAQKAREPCAKVKGMFTTSKTFLPVIPFTNWTSSEGFKKSLTIACE